MKRVAILVCALVAVCLPAQAATVARVAWHSATSSTVYVEDARGVLPLPLDGIPRWAPDGRRVAALHGYPDSSLRVVDVETQQVVMDLPGPWNGPPCWVDDQTLIATERHAVYAVDVPDGERQLLDGGSDAPHYVRGCSQRHGLYALNFQDPLRVELRAFDFVTGQVSVLPQPEGTIVDRYEFSPDGSHIAISTGDEIGLLAADGSGYAPLAGGSGLLHPRWSPDGETIVFRGAGDALEVVGVDGAGRRHVPLDLPPDHHLSTVYDVAPDGQHVLVDTYRVSAEGGKGGAPGPVMIVDIDTGAVLQVTPAEHVVLGAAFAPGSPPAPPVRDHYVRPR